MNWLFFKNPESGKPDLMTSMVIVVTTATVIKFLLDGVTVAVKGYSFDFGHMDSLTYSAMLAPVLGLHGWLEKLKGTTEAK